MIRLFIKPLREKTDTIELDTDNSHYLRDVLRVQSGDDVTAFDGTGKEYLCKVADVKVKVTLSIIQELQSDIRPLKNLILVQGLLKGQKMDLVVQKAAEIGVSSVIPVVTERSQVRTTSKTPRWKKIAEDASRQCHRTDLVSVSDVISFEEFVRVQEKCPSAAKIVFYENGEKGLGIMENAIRSARDIMIFIGPEGGFSRREIDILTGKGFHVAFLGKMIMRAETAAIVVSGIIQYINGQFD